MLLKSVGTYTMWALWTVCNIWNKNIILKSYIIFHYSHHSNINVIADLITFHVYFLTLKNYGY